MKRRSRGSLSRVPAMATDDTAHVATPIIIDCDPGRHDAIAILLALASPEVELEGITTVHGNQTLEKTTRNALRVLELLVGRGDVPVARGAERPLVRFRRSPITCTARAARRAGAARADGRCGRRERSVLPPRGASRRVVPVPTGSLTNVSQLLSEYPDVRPERIVDDGAIGLGNITPAAVSSTSGPIRRPPRSCSKARSSSRWSGWT